jgi:hypothetical protein
MKRRSAVALAVSTFVVGLAIAVAIFAALDVKLLYLVGPAIAIGAAAFTAYRSAHSDGSQRARGDRA